MPREPANSFRLGAEYRRKLDRIAAERRMNDTETIRAALDELGLRIFGKRWEADPDMTPIKRRTPKG